MQFFFKLLILYHENGRKSKFFFKVIDFFFLYVIIILTCLEGGFKMSTKINCVTFIFISILIILFTEIVGINMEIAFYYLTIFFAILTMIFFNIKLKKMVDFKKGIIINIIIILINFIVIKFITGMLNYNLILAVLIFCKFLDKIKDFRIDKEFIKSLVKYYILPLAILLIVYNLYLKMVNGVNSSDGLFLVDYYYLDLMVLYTTILVDIVILILGNIYDENMYLNIDVSFKPKSICIIFSVIIVILFCIKIGPACKAIGDANDRIDKLNGAIRVSELNVYYKLDFDPNIKIENNYETKMQGEFEKYRMSLNPVLSKFVLNWGELSFKLETNGIQQLVKKRTIGKKEALEKYKESSRKYIKIIESYKDELYMYSATFFIIYSIDIMCIFVMYKKCEE